jgi:hypothetical protein
MWLHPSILLWGISKDAAPSLMRRAAEPNRADPHSTRGHPTQSRDRRSRIVKDRTGGER